MFVRSMGMRHGQGVVAIAVDVQTPMAYPNEIEYKKTH